VSIPIVFATMQLFVGGYVRIDAGASEDVTCDVGLFREVVPKLEWEGFIGSAEPTDEMVFKCLDSPFSGVDAMVVGLNKLNCSVLFLHEGFYWFGGLVVRDVECGFVPLVREGFEHVLESSNDVTVRRRVDGHSKDIVRIIRICNKK